jgi:hypothetical protein
MKNVWIATNVTQGRLNLPVLRRILGPGESTEVTEPIPVEIRILTGRPKLLTLTPKAVPAENTAQSKTSEALPRRRQHN